MEAAAGVENEYVNGSAPRVKRVKQRIATAGIRRASPTKSKSSPFDTLVTRYYPGVYSFALRLTDDPRQAIELTRYAFDSTRNQLLSCSDKNLIASILMANVIRAALSVAESSLAQTAGVSNDADSNPHHSGISLQHGESWDRVRRSRCKNLRSPDIHGFRYDPAKSMSADY